MACNFLNRELGIITRSVARFIDLTVGRAMGCFFGCLRVRADRPRPHVLRLSESAEPAVSRNRISSLFVDEEEKGDSRSPQISNDLKDEAKFLKACGTIPETPVEIRKASRKFKQSPPCGEDSEASEFHSWLPDASIDKFQLDQPPTPNKLFESPGRSSNSLENTPISCISSAVNTGMSTMCSSEGSEVITVDKTVKTGIFTASAYGKNKSVRFECESDACSKSENNGQNIEKRESLGYQSASRYSPNPTPLKIYDEMQTPGTVFPFNVENLANGKTRIRSEYVHSVSNQDMNASLLNAMKEEPFSSKEMVDELEDSPERLENDTTELEIRVKQTSLVNDAEDVGSLSTWLKPKGPKQYSVDDSNKNILPMSTKTPGDRPIIGLVAAHWNDNESSGVSPKWWDGNGIPNSTTKYKEDQKVSWHATPFEERLEKALSDETRISQRKHVSQPWIYLDEADDSDTALSQLRPPSHSRSVVSV